VETIVWSIIVPCPSVEPEPAVIAALQSSGLNLAETEILIAEGLNPPRQRNEAAANATGEFLIFLDSDCLPDAAYFSEIARVFKEPSVEVVGGPIVLPPYSSPLQKFFQGLLSHPLITGPVACRYAPLGRPRRSGQAELILANLAIRRHTWERFDELDETLFPNEENEWLDRLKSAGVGIWYAPEMKVPRPQRESWVEFFHMLIRYGRGRTHQTLISRKFSVFHHLPAILLLLGLILFWINPLIFTGLLGFLYVLYGFAVLYSHSPENPGTPWKLAVAWPLVILGYGFGQWSGLWMRSRIDSHAPVQVFKAEPVHDGES
jgi:glycosyltransferase involved in cell wall biosynthesis